MLVITLTLHPSGSGIHQIIKMPTVNIKSHGIGIVSIPFIIFGFFGYTKKIIKSGKLE